MDEAHELKNRQSAMVLTKNRAGRLVMRYKPGTLIKDSRENVYRVEESGAWVRVKR